MVHKKKKKKAYKVNIMCVGWYTWYGQAMLKNCCIIIIIIFVKVYNSTFRVHEAFFLLFFVLTKKKKQCKITVYCSKTTNKTTQKKYNTANRFSNLIFFFR